LTVFILLPREASHFSTYQRLSYHVLCLLARAPR
jgi:hypothetical protein